MILADEPTVSLDSETGKQIMDLFKSLSQDRLIIIVSHDLEFAKQYADRIISLKDGEIIHDSLLVMKPQRRESLPWNSITIPVKNT